MLEGNLVRFLGLSRCIIFRKLNFHVLRPNLVARHTGFFLLATSFPNEADCLRSALGVVFPLLRFALAIAQARIADLHRAGLGTVQKFGR